MCRKIQIIDGWTNTGRHGSMWRSPRSSVAMDHHAIARAAEIVDGARRVVALTGAGISRPSGIPDFRSVDGLWTRDDPMVVASLAGFRADPRRFYRWVQPLIDTIDAALPNPAH